MRDEHLALGGWLLADLVLILAVIFLAMAPAGPKPLAAGQTPTPTPTATAAKCDPQTNFQFDQIVVRGVGAGANWNQINAGTVRHGLTKYEELDDGRQKVVQNGNVLGYLRSQQAEGFKIALTETWGWTAPSPFVVTVADNVTKAFIRAFEDGTLPSELRLYGVEQMGVYASSQIEVGSARINLYLVRDGCPKS